jgi:hypothetical protein
LYIRTKTLVIYRSAWKVKSANFAFTEFSEVRKESFKYHSFGVASTPIESYVANVT